MIALQRLEPQEVKKQTPFTFQDIDNILFNKKPYYHTCYPFLKLRNSPYVRLKLGITICIPESITSETLIRNSIVSVNDVNIEPSEFANLIGGWAVPYLVEEYKGILNQWIEYFYAEIDNFCAIDYSKTRWAIVSNGGFNYLFKDKLNIEQSIWIAANHTNTDIDKSKFAISLKDSLLPWLNYDMYSNYIKNKENKKENADYAKNKTQLEENG